MTVSASMVKELRDQTGCAMMDCKKALLESDGDIQAAVDLLRKKGMATADKRSSKTAAEGKVVATGAADGKTAFMAEVNSETDFVARDASFNTFVNLVAEQGLAHQPADLASTLSIAVDGQTLDDVRTALIGKIGENIQVRRVATLSSNGVIGTYCHGDRIAVMVALDIENESLAKDIAMHIAASAPQALTPADVPEALVAKEREIFGAQAKESGKSDDIVAKMVEGRVAKFLKEVSLTAQPFVKDPSVTVAQLLQSHAATIESFVRFEVGEGIEKQTQDFASEVMAQVKGTE